MSLPATLDDDVPAGSNAPSTLDNRIRETRTWLLDVFGIADDVAISAAVSEIDASGLKNLRFYDSTGDPGTAGYLQRNGANLLFHDGTAARTLVSTAATQTLTNKTLTSPTLTTPSITTASLVTSLILEAGANDYTITWAAPAAARGLSIADPGGADEFVFKAMTQTLTNKTLTTPTIASFVNAGHDHEDAAGGGALDAAAIGTGQLAVARGGTGVDGSAAANGQLLIGNDTNNDFDLATLTAGGGMTITNGAGSITLADAPGGAINGLALSNNAGDATNDIDIAVGGVWSEDAVLASRVFMSQTAALTKKLDAAWAVGTNQGALDIGTLADGTYHWYTIMRPDTGVVDALASRNPNRAATVTVTIASPGVVTWADHGLQVGSSVVFSTTGALPTGLTAGTRYYVISAGLTVDEFQVSASEGGAAVDTTGTQSGVHTATSAPVLPADYTKSAWIGSTLRESAALVPFIVFGDRVYRKAPVLDVDVTAPGTSAVTRTLSVPIGRRVIALVNVRSSGSASTEDTGVYLSALDADDLAASESVAPLFTVGGHQTGTFGTVAPAEVLSSHGAQVRSRNEASSANIRLRIATVGWINRPGRND